MNPAQLLACFERISEAQDAMPRLRQFVLDLAIRGRLVSQDPKDEPASELLKRIQTTNVQLVTQKNVSKRDGAGSSFRVPQNWVTVPLMALGAWAIGSGFPKNEQGSQEGAYPFIKVSDMNRLGNEKYITSSQSLIDDDTVARLRVKIHPPGTIIFPKIGGAIATNKRRILSRPSAIDNNCLGITFSSELTLDWCYLLLTTLDFSQYQAGTAMPALQQGVLGNVPINLPPLAEQHRIVAKVNEVMELCDRLEAAQSERESRRNRLVAATLQRLGQPTSEDATAVREHARFCLCHLPRLTSRPEQAEQLRDTILELAVTGKLSQQLSTDGKAQDLLSRLGRVRRSARKDSTSDAMQPREPLPLLPESWAWSIIGQVAAEDDNAITDGPFGANLKTAHYVETPGYRVVRLQNIDRRRFRTEHRSYIDKERFERLAKHQVFGGDLVVAGLVDPFVRCCEVPYDLGPAMVKADCYRFKVHQEFSSRFAMYYLNSPLCQRFAAVHHHGMTLVRIGLGNFRRIPIPVPPLAEQKRIVAKVDELMVLCDRLEAQLTITQAESRRLLEALLHEALAVA